MNLPLIPSMCCSWASVPFPLAHLYAVMSLISLQSPPHIYFVPGQPRGSGMAWQWWVNVLGTLVLTSGSVTSPSPSSSASPLGANHRTSSATHSHCSGLFPKPASFVHFLYPDSGEQFEKLKLGTEAKSICPKG